MKIRSILLCTTILISGCSTTSLNTFRETERLRINTIQVQQPPVVPRLNLDSPDFDLEPSIVNSSLQDKDDTFVVASSPPTPSYQDFSSFIEEETKDFNIDSASYPDLLRIVAVDYAGYSVIYPQEFQGTASFVGSQFTPQDAISSLSELFTSDGFSVTLNNKILTIGNTNNVDNAPSTVPSRSIVLLNSSSPLSVSESLSTLYSGLNVSNVGRNLLLAGGLSDVSSAVRFVRDIDNSNNSSGIVPWRVVRVSNNQIKTSIEDLVSSISNEEDPVSFNIIDFPESQLVLISGYNEKLLDDTVSMIQQIDAGFVPKITTVFQVSNIDDILSSLETSFSNDVENNLVSFSQVGSQLVVNGNSNIVSSVRSFVEKVSPVPTFLDVRAVVAETTRGSSVDRNFTFSLGQELEVPEATINAGSLSASVGSFSTALSYLDRDSDTKLLATPRLSVSSGSTADLVVGSQVPVLNNVGEDGQQEVSYRDSGITLNVSPTVLADGRIRIDITQELSNATTNEFSDLDSPAFSTRSMNTEVVVNPGEVVSVAGLDYDTYSLSNNNFNTGSGSSESRKLVLLVSATPSSSSTRLRTVQDSVSQLNNIFRSYK